MKGLTNSVQSIRITYRCPTPYKGMTSCKDNKEVKEVENNARSGVKHANGNQESTAAFETSEPTSCRTTRTTHCNGRLLLFNLLVKKDQPIVNTNRFFCSIDDTYAFISLLWERHWRLFMSMLMTR